MATGPSPPGVERLRLYFSLDTLQQHLPLLADRPSFEEYERAFAVRDELAELFLGDHPFFARPNNPIWQLQRGQAEELAR